MLKLITKILKEKPIAKNSLINLSTRFTTLVVSLAYIGYISRSLSTTELGIFAVMFIFFALFGMFGGLGLSSTGMRLIPEMADKKEDQNVADMIKLTITISTIATLIITGISLAADKSLTRVFLKSAALTPYMDWIIINSLVYSIFDRLMLIYQTFQNFKMMSGLNIITLLAQRFLAILFCSAGYGLFGIMAGFLLGSCLGTAMALAGLYKYLKIAYKNYPAVRFIKFSMPFYGQGIMRFIFMQADQTLIAFIFTPDKLAIYFIAKKIISLITMVFEAIYDTIIPRLAQIKHKGLEVYKAYMHKIMQGLVSMVLLGLGLIFLNSKLLMLALGGPGFAPYFYLLDILSVSMLTYVIYIFSTTEAYLFETPQVTFRISLYVGISAVVLEITLGMLFGLVGFSLAQALGYLIGILVVRYKYKRCAINFSLKDNIYILGIVLGCLCLGHIINSYFLDIRNHNIIIIQSTLLNTAFAGALILFCYKNRNLIKVSLIKNGG